ncbi:sugar ABC transporter permease [Sphaerochaeta sp.]|jgi:ABC-type sugar transport system permease subunit|uniref:carbohydrate ABC transporter permease n=1 Tax=Sphaerochaeta sp. TaxID=1972642 RepID=UPI002589EFBC|nr:sugar ABC transporter permease [Sphaerochaeta sp.]NCC12922.1 sugar ABC transporter permease [Spirochaetia bacterium]MDD2394973.1 sugar ABC transporter permease [Sphaerochaeta sp.]MDD3424866.1 sugar ABC transporter permease [Sphaerochaeta sp.]MDD3456140.1 sugar ABC transporter permease [Sphaerochaeta sp.]MDD4038513.1 sugar ABC transporter permease [Sphaerochaeta sp.]
MERYVYKRGGKQHDLLAAILINLLPTLLLTLVFQLVPILIAGWYSFLKVNLMAGTKQFIGLDNYIKAATDPKFLQSMATTVEYFLLRVPLQVLLGFLLSLLIYQPRRWTGVLRTIILLPVVTSMVVVTSILALMMHPSNGLINSMLIMAGLPAQGFLTDPRQALFSIVLITVWKNVGMTMLFFLAGLMAISPTLYEAAEIDGATALQKHWHVTIPMLKNTFIFVLITTTIRSFQVFGPILMTTNGGPLNSTRVVVMEIYENAFVFNQLGYASTQSVLLALLLIVISLLQSKLSGRKSR